MPINQQSSINELYSFKTNHLKDRDAKELKDITLQQGVPYGQTTLVTRPDLLADKQLF